MSGHFLTLNAGSSSIKFSMFAETGDELSLLTIGQVEGIGTRPKLSAKDGAGTKIRDEQLDAEIDTHAEALDIILGVVEAVAPGAAFAGIGHRVVHGGPQYSAPALVDAKVLADLEALTPLAPLHQPHNVAGLKAAMAHFPGVPQVACFDTAFHRRQSFVNDVFAIPRKYYDEGVRRYGFHGLSYEFVEGKLSEIAPHHAVGRVIIAHLGSGASMCALRNGHSMASTMGFSPLDGLPMGTRPGQLDPGVLLYLMSQHGYTPDGLRKMLYSECGLKGLSGLSNDMRDLEAAGTKEARQAIDYFVFRCRREIGGLAAVLEGLDAIVFCGGIGENSWTIRESILEGMEWIGVELDLDANRAGAQIISSSRSRVRVFVIRTDEEQMIARHTRALLHPVSPAAAAE